MPKFLIDYHYKVSGRTEIDADDWEQAEERFFDGEWITSDPEEFSPFYIDDMEEDK